MNITEWIGLAVLTAVMVLISLTSYRHGFTRGHRAGHLHEHNRNAMGRIMAYTRGYFAGQTDSGLTPTEYETQYPAMPTEEKE